MYELHTSMRESEAGACLLKKVYSNTVMVIKHKIRFFSLSISQQQYLINMIFNSILIPLHCIVVVVTKLVNNSVHFSIFSSLHFVLVDVVRCHPMFNRFFFISLHYYSVSSPFFSKRN